MAADRGIVHVKINTPASRMPGPINLKDKRTPLFTVLLPTFNESENVEPILRDLRKVLRKHSGNYEILFVDDSSDKTPRVIQKFQKKYPDIRLLHRRKAQRTGLATALAVGLKAARGEYVCSMDSDLQHPPTAVAALIDKIIAEDSDIVVATRYLPGGSAEGLGSNYRKLVSKFCRLVAWVIIAATRKTTDPGSGFFVVRRDFVEDISFHRLYGFKILIDVLARAPHARVAEVPYAFRKRDNNESKATFKQGLQFFRHIWSLFKMFIFSRMVRTLLGILFLVLAGWMLKLTLSMTQGVIEAVVLSIAVLLMFQGGFTVFLMLYAWENPARVKRNKSPKKYYAPQYSFTALLPARHEEKVIADTIRSISRINYPEDKKELLVLINENDDAETIRIAQEAIATSGQKNIRLITFRGPLGKARGLNLGLKEARHDLVTIFDAEDEIHRDIYQIINTVMLRDKSDVVQSGVQLMNYHSNWYSLFNVMEYFFWFKSALHFFAKNNMITLGGNTVFFKRKWLVRIGGWDEKNLTEDADIGLRLCAAGARIKVVYDEEHVTKEETPPTLRGFIKQRTRWNQGFIQILFKGDWLRLPTWKQKFLAFYVLSWPIFQGLLFVLLPFSFLAALRIKMLPLLGIISNLPLYVFFILFVVVNIGIYDFMKNFENRYLWSALPRSLIFFVPYQIILSVSAFRAILRQIGGNLSWEKTVHLNIRDRQGTGDDSVVELQLLKERK